MSGAATPSAGPIFIGGPDRCGKTLVSALLASHSRISVPAVGSNLWPLFYRQHGDLSDPRNAERCLTAMLQYKHIAFLAPDPEPILALFRDGPRTYARLFALVQEQYAARAGKVRWGDQTGLVERYADEIFASYPDVRMIQLVRDPRDRYAESLARWPTGRLRVGGATARWLFSTQLGLRNAGRYGDRYLLLRYETLVTEPEATVRRVCEFLGEPFEPEMLQLRGIPTYRAKLEASLASLPSPGPPTARSPISPAFIGGYRSTLSARELAFMQGRTATRMARFGYAADAVQLPLGDRLRLALIDTPVNRVRMRIWWWREELAYRFPRWLGHRHNRPLHS